LQGEHGVGRVIARPFTGKPGSFRRTQGRRDFSLEPTGPTILDVLTGSGFPVVSVGKVWDIFAGRGIGRAYGAASNEEAMASLLQALAETRPPAFIFANFIDFDSLWGHRNDPPGYAAALEAFDQQLPALQQALGP